MAATELKSEQLYRRCDIDRFDFETTEHLEPVDDILGQPRAVDAVRFGVDIRREGYNIFALGSPGVGKRTLVQQYLQHRAPSEPAPDDWCYVYNFDQSHKPNALRLPAGRGCDLRHDMDHLIDDALLSLSGAFESEEYRHQRQQLQQQFENQQKEAFEEFRKDAERHGLAVMPGPQGLMFAPAKPDGRPMSREEAEQLSQEKRQELETEAENLQQRVQQLMQQAPRAQREARRNLSALNRDHAEKTITPLIDDLVEKFGDLPEVGKYLQAVKQDMVENSEVLVRLQRTQRENSEEQPDGDGIQEMMEIRMQQQAESDLLRRYRVNELVCHTSDDGAPVIYENHPSYQNLIGRIEHHAHMGTLVADFNLIKAGALHRANGGYLVLEAHKLLMLPESWSALKRALQAEEIRIESLGQVYGLISTVTLEPQPIPLSVKVVLLGSRELYYLLRELDPDFAELFKVPADFDIEMDRDSEQETYARLIGTVARKEQLRHFDRSAVGRVIEHSSRIAGDTKKLSIHMRSVADLLREADYWASTDGNGAVTAADVEKAIDSQVYRCDRIRQRIQEAIERGTLLIDTVGELAGQVNGLAVIPFGDLMFGKPSRITARVRMGKGDVVDIEREVALGGPLHSKGVLILAGFLTGRYAQDAPLSLSASLVFEQSYSGIGGDSASSAELYALMSAIADLPIRQALAVTGSVNQHGRIQAIGGVNEKIEGFFDVCRARGLTGEQGVLIPVDNVEHLMLRKDVVQAVRKGQFHVYSVRTIDEGIELLTGVPAGEKDSQGEYPPDSVNGRIQARLADLARQRRKFAPAAVGEAGD